MPRPFIGSVVGVDLQKPLLSVLLTPVTFAIRYLRDAVTRYLIRHRSPVTMMRFDRMEVLGWSNVARYLVFQ